MKTVLSVAAASFIAISLGGCSHSISPGMQGLAHTDKEVGIMRKVEMNQNGRMISDDLARAFYLDHPSHLSGYPVTDTSGMPR